jgi:hypothetical protein
MLFLRQVVHKWFTSARLVFANREAIDFFFLVALHIGVFAPAMRLETVDGCRAGCWHILAQNLQLSSVEVDVIASSKVQAAIGSWPPSL